MWIVADVTFDTDAEAREAERLAREGKIDGVSVDVTDYDFEVEVTEVDEFGEPRDWIETGIKGEIIGATQTPMRAFEGAHIEFTETGPVAWLVPEGEVSSDRRRFAPGVLRWREGAELMFNDSSDGHDGAVFVGNLTNFRRVGVMSLVASVAPDLAGVTRPKVIDGKLVGHGAGWGTCHVGIANACVTPPSSTYRHVPEGAKVYRHPRGDIHAPLSLGLDEAMRWYETHCEVVGVVGVGEDDYGIWVNGDASLEDGDYFISGDWRADGDNLELISFLLVDNPGFPTAMVASDTQSALTAAGIVTETSEPSYDARLKRLELVLFTPRPDPELVEFFERENLAEAFNL